MVELTNDEMLSVIHQLSLQPYHEVQELILLLTKKLIAGTEATDREEFRKELMGES